MIKKLFKLGIQLGLSQTARALYWLFSGNMITIVLAFFTTILIARFVTKEQFGIFLALYSFAALLGDIGDIGIGPSLSNFLPPLLAQKQNKEVNRLLSTAFYLEMGIGSLLLLGVITGSTLLAKYFFESTQQINVFVAGGIMISIILFNFATFALSAQKKFRESALIGMASSLIRLFLLIAVAITAKLTLFNILLIYFISLLLGWAYSLLFLNVRFLKHDVHKNEISRLVRFSGYLGLQKIFVAISSRLDLLMIVPLAGAYSAGIYGAAGRVAQVFPFFISSFSQVMAPKFAEYRQGKTAVAFFKKAGLVALLMLGVMLIFFLGADLLMAIFFPKYTESVPVLRALLISMVGFVAATPFVSFIIYTLRKPAVIAISTLVQLSIIFVGNLIFIPKVGSFGPAISTGLGNLAVLAIAVGFTWYHFKTET